MIYDVRTYTCRPGTMNKQLAMYAEHGYHVQCRHLGVPVIYATGEVGDANSYVHIWAYDSMADREQRRKAMWSDPEWLEMIKLADDAGYLISQKNAVYTQVPFSPEPNRG